jgi:hypothetical protein
MRASKGRVTCYGLCFVGFYIMMGDVVQCYIGYFMTNTIGKELLFLWHFRVCVRKTDKRSTDETGFKFNKFYKSRNSKWSAWRCVWASVWLNIGVVSAHIYLGSASSVHLFHGISRPWWWWSWKERASLPERSARASSHRGQMTGI